MKFCSAGGLCELQKSGSFLLQNNYEYPIRGFHSLPQKVRPGNLSRHSKWSCCERFILHQMISDGVEISGLLDGGN